MTRARYSRSHSLESGDVSDLTSSVTKNKQDIALVAVCIQADNRSGGPKTA